MRRSLPLALTIVVHLILAAGLYLARQRPPPATPTSQRVFLLMFSRRPDVSPLRKAPQTMPRPARPVQLARPRVALEVAPPPAAQASPAVTAAPQPSAGELLARARRDAGKIDRELRAGTLAPLSADSPRARFERAFAAAGIDRSHTLVMDRYVSPDGVAITRLSNGSGAKCYMSGTVNFVPGILHDSARPQAVTCPPPGSGWTRK